MTIDDKPSLAEQRQSIRGQLRLQREVVALQLAPSDGHEGRFPRSMTMRALIHRPELVARLATLLAGARFAGKVSATLDVVRQLAQRRGALPIK